MLEKLRSLFHSRGTRRRPGGRAASPRPSFRPRLEALECRAVPTISHAFLANGQVVTLVAFDNGVLYSFSPSYTGLLGTNVKDAHAYRDGQGQFGMDIVFKNGQAYQIDSTGTHFLGQGVHEASTTYAANGNFVTLLALENGAVLSQTNSGTTLVGTNFDTACTYLDANGNFGFFFAIKTGGDTSNLLQVDSTIPGGRVLGPGFQEAEANYGPGGQFFIDLRRDNGDTYEITPTNASFIGSDF